MTLEEDRADIERVAVSWQDVPEPEQEVMTGKLGPAGVPGRQRRRRTAPPPRRRSTAEDHRSQSGPGEVIPVRLADILFQLDQISEVWRSDTSEEQRSDLADLDELLGRLDDAESDPSLHRRYTETAELRAELTSDPGKARPLKSIEQQNEPADGRASHHRTAAFRWLQRTVMDHPQRVAAGRDCGPSAPARNLPTSLLIPMGSQPSTDAVSTTPARTRPGSTGSAQTPSSFGRTSRSPASRVAPTTSPLWSVIVDAMLRRGVFAQCCGGT